MPSAPFDATKPLRNHITSQWFLHDAQRFKIYISELTINELAEWSNKEKEQGALALIANAHILTISPQIENLAKIYIQKGAIPPTELNDALHLACATLNDIHCFISWDFRHIVSVNPILKIKEIHQKMQLPQIEIGTLSLVGADKYGVFEPEKFKNEKFKI